jgi:hypothetical protein
MEAWQEPRKVGRIVLEFIETRTCSSSAPIESFMWPVSLVRCIKKLKLYGDYSLQSAHTIFGSMDQSRRAESQGDDPL